MSGYEKIIILCVCVVALLLGCVSQPGPTEPAPTGVRETSVMIKQEKQVIDVNRDLLHAAFNGQTPELIAALEPVGDESAEGEDVLVEDGLTALLLASVRGHSKSVRVLVDAGVDVNGKTVRGGTALMWAAGSHEDSAETVEVLLELGANVNAKTVDGRTALMDAAMRGNTGSVQNLLFAGANVNKQTVRRVTPLLEAVQQGHVETVKLLLIYGAEVNIRDREGNTPLTAAKTAGFNSIVQLLQEAGAVDILE